MVNLWRFRDGWWVNIETGDRLAERDIWWLNPATAPDQTGGL